MGTPDNAMFAGIRVVELAQFVFVPAAGAVLADLGAEVVKVELVAGDPYRTLRIADGRQTRSANLAMEQNNRGKKSVGVDLKTAEGRELLLKLVETADVFLTSLRPGALDRLGLTTEVLRARNPQLVHVRGNGLGFRGAEADRPGYDATAFWARGGFAQALSSPGQYPTRPRPALGDHTGGMNIAFGIAAALFNRERTGRGADVEISLLSSAMWTLSSDVTVAAALTDEQLSKVAREGLYALKRAYCTSDGRWIQLMFLDPERYWKGLCARIGRPDLLSDSRFDTLENRIEHGDALVDLLIEIFAARDLASWREAFDGWDAPWEVCQTIRDLTSDPQAVANDYMFKVRVEDGTEVTLVAGPVSFNGSPLPASPACAPLLGQHTDEIFAPVAGGPEAIGGLKRRGILA